MALSLRSGLLIVLALFVAWVTGLLSLSAYADEASDAGDAPPNTLNDLDLLRTGCDREVVQARLIGTQALSPSEAELPPELTARPLDLAARIFDPACISAVLDLAPDGGEVGWQADQGGRWYRLTPVKSFVDSTGQFCRVFTAAAGLRDDGWQRYGIACRASGGWTMVR